MFSVDRNLFLAMSSMGLIRMARCDLRETIIGTSWSFVEVMWLWRSNALKPILDISSLYFWYQLVVNDIGLVLLRWSHVWTLLGNWKMWLFIDRGAAHLRTLSATLLTSTVLPQVLIFKFYKPYQGFSGLIKALETFYRTQNSFASLLVDWSIVISSVPKSDLMLSTYRALSHLEYVLSRAWAWLGFKMHLV